MKPAWLCAAANAVVCLSLADGVVSLLDEGLQALGIGALYPIRAVLAGVTAVAVLASLPAMALTPRLPLAVFLPLALGTLWLLLGGAPLGMWLSPGNVMVAACVLQVGLAGLAFAMIRRHNGGRRWLFDAESPSAPAFTARRSLGFAATALVAGLPVLGLYLVLLAATYVESATRGFVAFDLNGVSLADRRYAKEDREVRLVGMMHLGEDAGYRALVSSFSEENTVVLAEGLTDESGRLGESLHYGRAAEALGLSPQGDLRDYLVDSGDPDSELPRWPEVRHADIDASAFAPETITWLRRAAAVWASPNFGAAFRELIETARQTDPAELAAFQYEILDLRNEHLIGELDAALEEYPRVIVPWGALHLPVIEEAVIGRGFTLRSRAEHPLLSWRTIVDALRESPGAVAGIR